MVWLSILTISYLIGVFPTGMLISRYYGIKIEKTGSGNVGATNVARIIGKKAGIITLLGDVAKGIIATLIARLLWSIFLQDTNVSNATFFNRPTGSSFVMALGGLFAVLGHCFSIPFHVGRLLQRLKGGKGVATALGVLLTAQPILALTTIISFMLIFYFSHIVSLSSIVAATLMPIIYLFLFPNGEQFIPFAIMASVITYRHSSNIKRLIEGNEKKFTTKRVS